MKKLLKLMIIATLFALLLSMVAFAREIEDNNSLSQANQIEINKEVTGNLNTQFDSDWYKFTVTEEGYFNITFKNNMSREGAEKWRIAVYKDSYTTFYGSEQYLSVTSREYTSPTFRVSSGTYYFNIISGSGSSSAYSGEDYKVMVDFTQGTDFEYENNNLRDYADLIELNTVKKGQLCLASDEDFFKFKVEKDGYITVSLSHLTSKSYVENAFKLTVYTVKNTTTIGDTYYVKTNTDFETVKIGVSSGLHYVKISTGSDYIRDIYSLKVSFTESEYWETEKNDTISSAIDSTLGKEYNGYLYSTNDIDYYRFNITSEGYISLTYEGELESTEEKLWHIDVYNAQEEKLFYLDCTSNEGVSPSLGVKAGIYYVKISKGEVYSDSNYSLKIDFTEESGWEKELNGSIGEADELLINSSIKGSLATSEDYDWYSVALDKSYSLKLLLKSEGALGNEKHWKITVYDSALEELFIKEADGVNEPMEFTTMNKGLYYIKIEPLSYSQRTYSLSVCEEHTCVGKDVVIKAPTCTEEGKSGRACQTCGKILSENVVEPLGHSATEYVVEKEPSCSEKGQKSYTCALCNEKTVEEVDKIPHTYTGWTIVSGSNIFPPTIKEKECVNCGNKETVKDWSNIWKPILILIFVASIVIGVINYIRAYKKSKGA